MEGWELALVAHLCNEQGVIDSISGVDPENMGQGLQPRSRPIDEAFKYESCISNNDGVDTCNIGAGGGGIASVVSVAGGRELEWPESDSEAVLRCGSRCTSSRRCFFFESNSCFFKRMSSVRFFVLLQILRCVPYEFSWLNRLPHEHSMSPDSGSMFILLHVKI